MSLSTRVKHAINLVLDPLNLKLDSLTAERRDAARLKRAAERGSFDQPVFPILRGMDAEYQDLLAHLKTSSAKFSSILTSHPEYSIANDYFTTPDAEVLLAIVERYRPRRVVEIGSGNSTLLFRMAADGAQVPLRVTSIDPAPRRSVESIANDTIRQEAEVIEVDHFRELAANDILFIDSSHEIRVGNDVLQVFFHILPTIKSGVLIHFHDIFLPFEYPRQWVAEFHWPWTEQYLLQAFLTGNHEYNVLWPGHYLQRTMSDFRSYFPLLHNGTAKSFWIIKR